MSGIDTRLDALLDNTSTEIIAYRMAGASPVLDVWGPKGLLGEGAPVIFIPSDDLFGQVAFFTTSLPKIS